MSQGKERKNYPWMNLALGVLAGVDITLVAELAIQHFNPRLSLAGYRIEIQVGATPPPDGIPLPDIPTLETPLSLKVKEAVQQSLVKFQAAMPSFYDSYGFPSFGCNGFVIQDTFGKPLIATARHCFPQNIRSEADGNIYSTIDANGQNILRASVTDTKGKSYIVTPYNYYIGDNDSDIPDVMLFRVASPDFNLTGLPLNLETPPKWGTFYRVSLDGDQLTSHAFQFLETSSDHTSRFFSVLNPELACFHGTSGSAIVNNQGEVAALLIWENMAPVDTNNFIRLGLGLDSLGKDTVYCGGVDANLIKGLIRNQ